jgi:hypothetical protein
MQFPFKIDNNQFNCPTCDTKIYHKNHSNFFLKYHNGHLGNTLLVDDMPYKTCQNPHFNVIFIEFYEDMPEEENYLLGSLLPYLKLFHYSGFNVPTFVENYPFGAIRNLKEDDVKFWTLFEKCTMNVMPISIEIN